MQTAKRTKKIASSAVLNRYVEGRSLFHRADARVKLVVALGYIFAMTSIPPGEWAAFGAMLLFAWSAAALSRVGMRRVFLRSLVAAPFMLIALPTAFTKAGAPAFELDLGILHPVATREGLEFAASVALKSWASVTVAVLLTSTTQPFTLLGALSALRVPAILVSIVMLMYRYLFVLVDEAHRLMRARAARSATMDDAKSGGSLLWRAKGAGGMAGSLFVRTMDRSERIYSAMLARGYDGRVRLAAAPPLAAPQYASIALAVSAFAAVAVLARVVS